MPSDLAHSCTVWPGWGATYTSGLELTRGHYALKQKYNLPLTPPPQLCVFGSNSSPNLCLPSNLVKKNLDFFFLVLPSENFLKIFFTRFYYILLGFTTARTRFHQMLGPRGIDKWATMSDKWWKCIIESKGKRNSRAKPKRSVPSVGVALATRASLFGRYRPEGYQDITSLVERM